MYDHYKTLIRLLFAALAFACAPQGFAAPQEKPQVSETSAHQAAEARRPVARIDRRRDKVAEIMAWYPSAGRWNIAPLEKDADGRLAVNRETGASMSWGANGDIPLTGDVDGDYLSDFVIFRPQTGQWFATSSDWRTLFRDVRWGARGDAPLLADIDGDGRDDLVVYRPGSGLWFAARPDGTTLARDVRWGASGDVPLSDDVDGDGRADFVFYRPSTGQWFAMSASGEVVFREKALSGARNAAPALGDVDGDGRAELIELYGNEGWSAFRVGNASAAEKIDGCGSLGGAGQGPFRVAAADVAGDGKDAVILYSQSSGTVHVQRPGCRDAWDTFRAPAPRPVKFGGNTDIVLVGDADGGAITSLGSAALYIAKGDVREFGPVYLAPGGDMRQSFSFRLPASSSAAGVRWQVASEPFTDDIGRAAPEGLVATGFAQGASGGFVVDFGDIEAAKGFRRVEPTTYHVRAFAVVSEGSPGSLAPASKAIEARVNERAPESVVDFDPFAERACAMNPQACCPEGGVCQRLFNAMFNVDLRSYVPPRFTHRGDFGSLRGSTGFADLVSRVSLTGTSVSYPVVAGCRYDPVVAMHAIREGMTIDEEFLELLTLASAQWSEIYEGVQREIANGVASAICGNSADARACRDIISSTVQAGIGVGLAALGMPPSLPDINELRENGIEYLATQAAGYAVDGLDEAVLKNVLSDPVDRMTAYAASYALAEEAFAAGLDEITPPAEWTGEDPNSWGAPDPAFAPRDARAYVRIEVKPEHLQSYRSYLESREDSDPGRQPVLRLVDHSGTWKRVEFKLPAYIDGSVVVPATLKPAYGPATDRSDLFTPAKIPGTEISRRWLETKFGLSATAVFSRQHDYIAARNGATIVPGDWDPFWDAKAKAHDFEIEAQFEPGGRFWSVSSRVSNGNAEVWDARTGTGALNAATRGVKDYYGRVDPAPRCDCRPTVAYFGETAPRASGAAPCGPEEGRAFSMSDLVQKNRELFAPE